MVGHLWCGSYSWPILSMFQDVFNFLPLHTKSEMQYQQDPHGLLLKCFSAYTINVSGFETFLPLHTKSEMQYHQEPHGPLLKTKEWVGVWSAHTLLKCCVCVLAARVSREGWVCVRFWSTRGEEQGRHSLEICLEISQASMFQIFTKNRPFILQSTFSQICVMNILKSFHMNLWLNQSISFWMADV